MKVVWIYRYPTGPVKDESKWTWTVAKWFDEQTARKMRDDSFQNYVQSFPSYRNYRPTQVEKKFVKNLSDPVS